MKPLNYFIFILVLSFTPILAIGQNEDIPFYDYEQMILSEVATMPETESKPNQLTITGKVLMPDGLTPAKNVILYLYQHDENGEFQFETYNDKERLRHRTWVKTDDQGNYTFNTFVPGEAIVKLNYPRRYGPKQFYLVAKLPETEDFALPALMFEDDPLISKNCKRRLKRKNIDCLISMEQINGKAVVKKDITLPAIDTVK